MRFYENTGGSAALDGREFSELNVNNLRSQVGYVGQLPTLFNGTVRQNVLLGKPDASVEEIEAACKAAQAHDFILNLSDGYETEVGPGGGLLSGGQKQRIGKSIVYLELSIHIYYPLTYLTLLIPDYL